MTGAIGMLIQVLNMRIAVFILTLFVAFPALGADRDAFLQRHCVDCHGPDKQKGDLRLDTLF